MEDRFKLDACGVFNPRRQVPGWEEIAQAEHESRNDAMLGLADSICGLKVKPLTWRHLLWLDIYQNAFLTSLTPDQLLQVNDIHLHVARFMWVLSPRWKPYSKFAHWRFNRLYKKTLYGRKNNTAEIVSAIHQFFEESIFDLKSESRGPQRKSYYSNATACAHALCHLYPSLSPDPTAPNAVIDLPLKIAGQLLRAHAKFENPKALLNNRTDVLEQNWLAELNENLKKN